MEDLIPEFIAESYEGLDRIDRHLITLRPGEDNSVALAEIFRAVHTMKGTVGFLGLRRLGLLAHAGESLLSRMRGGEFVVTVEAKALLAQFAARLREVLQLLEQRRHEGRRALDDDTLMLGALEKACGGVAGSEVRPAFALELDEAPRAADGESRRTDCSVRVEAETLDRMLAVARELAQMQGRLQHATAHPGGAEVLAQQANDMSERLLECVRQARMQPVKHLFGRFPRIAAEVAADCGKLVAMEIEGGDTRLDKWMLEALRDPLLHAVRNAIDHGIEMPAQRVARGKPAEGRLRLRAFEQGEKLVVEVRDDGGGVDVAKVLRRAVERKLIDSVRAENASEDEALELLFLPGFSTRDEVTMISGRGIGMDVVRDGIDRAGGAVEMSSESGVGTIVRMSLPRVAPILAALCECGDDHGVGRK